MFVSTRRILPWLAVFACLQPALADTLVTSQQQFRQAVSAATAGDTILLANGEWRDFEILFSGHGTPEQPVTLSAETRGQVFITGRSNLRLAGEHLVVSGLVFKDGYSPTKAVISYRANRDQLANHSRVTEVVIDHFNNPERHETDFWVMMYGRYNRFDHNHLEGKSNAGVAMAVVLDSEQSQQNHHRIDHNYFGPRPVLGSNTGETLRIGTSRYSLTDSYTLVENNFFDRCNGEVEIVSSKSGHNTFRGNVFYESTGTLTLRHGNDNLVENNVFLGNGVDHTGGIRVINKRQTVRNNYLAGLTGHRFGGALVVMNGVPDSPLNRYHQVEDAVIENNTIIDSDHIELGAGADAERSARILSTTFQHNLIVNTDTGNSIAVHDDISGIEFAGNVLSGVLEAPADQGFESTTIVLQEATNGLLYPAEDSAPAGAIVTAGASRSLTVIARENTGPVWYPKPASESVFAGGGVATIAAGFDTLTDAVENSQPGDIIELLPGAYHVSKLLTLRHPLTIRASTDSEPRPVIQFERSALFELQEGGSLELEGITIDGSVAPDAYGNSAIRTSRYSMLGNYRLHLNQVRVINLNRNHSFNFLKVAMHTMADEILIKNSMFRDITGHILVLDRETDDLGIYNAEYVTIRNSAFTNVAGSLASIYRGGTDESTFGPHFSLQNSVLSNVGRGNRNATGASLYLLGVQATRVSGNQFNDSAPVRVIHTVGEPVTSLTGNEFSNTAAPTISDYQRPVL